MSQSYLPRTGGGAIEVVESDLKNLNPPFLQRADFFCIYYRVKEPPYVFWKTSKLL